MASAVDNAWVEFVAFVEAGHDLSDGRLLPLVVIARHDALLGSLYPYASWNRLCFGWKQDGPEGRWPCIGVDNDGRFRVHESTYPPPGGQLADTASAEEAIATLKRHFPQSPRMPQRPE
jgi:hypothetical protein